MEPWVEPERWKQIDNLLQSALKHPAATREDFLRNACAGHPEMEEEVRTLLAAHQEADSFLEAPAMETAARGEARHLLRVDRNNKTSLLGETIAHYRVVDRLGAGGMGVVYRAEDLRLHRPVALKFLPEEIAQDASTLARFEREARAASSLNHPNICTIYGVEEYNHQPVIVMELLDGESVRDTIRQGIVPTEKILEFAIQIADALEAAHGMGIVHRDIKPANLFITRRGNAKILYLGLAKVEPALQDNGGETATIEAALTDAGSPLGTVSYMSPEQVRAQHLDARTDLFSFGIVLYEMATGKQPFRGETSGVIFDSILNRAPVAPIRLNPDLPAEFERIVDKCLEKDRDLRYQHASEIRTDLQRLKRDSGSGHATAAPPPEPTVEKVPTAFKKWRWTIAAGTVFMAAAAGYLLPRRAPKLTDKDTIVLADFENKTGDPVFDDTLRQGLSVELQQSPFLSLISDQRVRQTLGLMGQPKDARLTPEIAQQICERTTSAAILEGSIASLGSQYVLGLRARNCNTGEILDQEQIQAAKREDVLDSLSQIAHKFRVRVGESLATVETHSTPLREATTPSLEALKAYSTAMKVNLSSGGAEAIPFFRRAIEIDPEFALAHATLGLAYSNIGESVLSAESATKAWQLRDHTSDREKFFIEVTYHRQVTGNLEKAYQTLELWVQNYPRGAEPGPQDLLGGLSALGTGRLEQAIQADKNAIALNTSIVFAYSGLSSVYFFLDRFDEAENALKEASGRKLELPAYLVLGYNIAFLKGDKGQMDRTVALAQGKREAEHWITHSEALVLARSGQLRLAREFSRRAVDLAQKEGQGEPAAMYQASSAVWEALYGNADEARTRATAALALSKARDVEYAAALALGFAGDSSRSQGLVDDLEKRFPEDTMARFTYVPVLRALSLLSHGQPADAIERLKIATPYESAVNALYDKLYLGGLHSAYLRGEALAAAHQYPEAASEFQKILDHRGIVGADPIGALVHLQLGRLYTSSGDKAKAKAAYQDFLALWPNADSDIPILKQARTEFSNLL